ncbi:MAG: hypothetical protein WC827_03765 [Candidatus Paceibacterota bacterium]
MAYLIRTKNKKVQDPCTKFVGAYIPLRIHSCISLFSMATTISKSALIENVFNFWMEHNYTSEVEEKSYQDFSKIMYSKYLDLQVTRRALNYSFFLNEIKKELEYKGLTIPVIKKILDYIDKEHLKNKI